MRGRDSLSLTFEHMFEGRTFLGCDTGPDFYAVDVTVTIVGEEVDELEVDEMDVLAAIRVFGGSNYVRDAINGQVDRYLDGAASRDALAAYADWCDTQRDRAIEDRMLSGEVRP